MLKTLKKIDIRSNIVYVGVVVVFILFALMLSGRGFTSTVNLLNILRQSSIIIVMAMAMTFVIGAAEIDLSVGSIAGLASVATAMAIARFGVFPGILAGLLVGVLCGVINGLLVAWAKIPSFLVTLAMMGITVGVAQWITDSSPQPILNANYNFIFGGGQIGIFPVIIIWALVFFIIGVIILGKTRFGKYTLAVGANPLAAKYSGIDVAKVRFSVMFSSAMCAAVAGMLYAGRLQSGRFQWGDGDPRWHRPLRWPRLRRRCRSRCNPHGDDQQRSYPRWPVVRTTAGGPRHHHHSCRRSCQAQQRLTH